MYATYRIHKGKDRITDLVNLPGVQGIQLHPGGDVEVRMTRSPESFAVYVKDQTIGGIDLQLLFVETDASTPKKPFNPEETIVPPCDHPECRHVQERTRLIDAMESDWEQKAIGWTSQDGTVSYTVAELRAAFDAVEDKVHWKRPFKASVPMERAGVTYAAIIYFHGVRPGIIVEECQPFHTLMLSSPGYSG